MKRPAALIKRPAAQQKRPAAQMMSKPAAEPKAKLQSPTKEAVAESSEVVPSAIILQEQYTAADPDFPQFISEDNDAICFNIKPQTTHFESQRWGKIDPFFPRTRDIFRTEWRWVPKKQKMAGQLVCNS